MGREGRRFKKMTKKSMLNIKSMYQEQVIIALRKDLEDLGFALYQYAKGENWAIAPDTAAVWVGEGNEGPELAEKTLVKHFGKDIIKKLQVAEKEKAEADDKQRLAEKEEFGL